MGALEPLVRAVRDAEGMVLVVTGAGVSRASGIPTFRGSEPGAVWAKDAMELGTFRYFARDPAGSWSWYLQRFDRVLETQPNPAHRALADLERWQEGRGRPFLLVTQNVDPLHERAGSRALVKVHGSADRVRCSSHGCRYGAPAGSLAREEVDLSRFRADPREENVPRCPGCGALVRQHVLWFDEYYHGHRDYQWDRVLEAAGLGSPVLFAGTSFSVGVTELILEGALQRGAPVFSMDPARSALPGEVTQIQAPAEEALPELMRALAG